ncbi:TetR/AcrR family transcriptional regulator [Nocardia arizonensis]|uniref:TetR/AcrR family transcriptional regulator n=1 Tax=Nocardia arizonensis TaxID=1141647 RepID=UPI0009E879A6|nr:TetR/AcrR family transcriptional regulator [Nocardia arizonensis]
MARARDELDEKIMDAALDRILQVGIRRSSLDDIARRSGVNRVTIYRRFAGKQNLIEAVLERETERMLTEVTEIVTRTASAEAQIEETALYVLRRTRLHVLVAQLLAVAPEEVLTFFTVRGSEVVATGIDFIVGLLRRAQELGLIAAYDPVPVAEIIARLAHSVMLTPQAGVDFADEEAVRQFLRVSIVPMVEYGIGPPPATTPNRPKGTSRSGSRAARGRRGAQTRTAAGSA